LPYGDLVGKKECRFNSLQRKKTSSISGGLKWRSCDSLPLRGGENLSEKEDISSLLECPLLDRRGKKRVRRYITFGMCGKRRGGVLRRNLSGYEGRGERVHSKPRNSKKGEGGLTFYPYMRGRDYPDLDNFGREKSYSTPTPIQRGGSCIRLNPLPEAGETL